VLALFGVIFVGGVSVLAAVLSRLVALFLAV